MLERRGQLDEYVLYLDDRQHGAKIEWNGNTVPVPGASIAFVPPRRQRHRLPTGAKPIPLLTVKSEDLVALCPNAVAYDVPRTHIPPFDAWPEPVGG